MEEIRSSSSASPPPTTTTIAGGGDHNNNNKSSMGAKKGCLSFIVSLKESFCYMKASIFGLAKKVSAKNEREASEAELKAAKMQVEAADAAEHAKAKIQKSA
ncbi:hypothetical protein G4B88_026729 [Cannabis sativa]|uniref:Uncharacterized protein n=1 Tax=Cannabis sativa TaxID=3483 RepID=A0A7J6F957_CANSA|nr:hypothetical protein G4B88_026729 [Cannabis sativa]